MNVSPNRPQRLKSKTGCLTCRVRRKKCSEERPTCIGCRRNYLICTWPPVEQLAEAMTAPTVARRQALSGGRNEGTAVNHEITFNKAQLRYLLPRTANIHSFIPNSIPGLHKESEKLIFDHYLSVTSTEIAGRVLARNPFVEQFIPVAYQDVRVKNCLLALSGAHLCVYKDNRFEHDARSHYAVTLRSVKHALREWKSSDTRDLIGLLIMMLSLCWFEIVMGDIDGKVYHHLRASRTVLLELRGQCTREVDGTLLDLLTEVYAFQAIGTNLTIHTDLPVNRHIPWDDFLSPRALLSLNRGNEIHGILFGTSHELLGLIIPIAQCARHYVREQDTGQRLKDLRSFESRIQTWNYVASPIAMDNVAEKAAGEINQQALLIFLHTTFNGTNKAPPALLERIDNILDLIEILARKLPPRSRIHTTLTWAARVVGSVCRQERHRAMMSRQMETGPANRPRAKYTESFLEELWAEMDKDDMVYGPYGIEIIMRRRNISLSCA